MSDPAPNREEKIREEAAKSVSAMTSAAVYRQDLRDVLALLDASRADLALARTRLAEVERAKDGAYSERDKVVAAFATVASALGWPVYLGTHVGEWEDDWRNIVFIDTPAGQVSWHYHDSERPLFWMHAAGAKTWDGHSTPQKYERLWKLTHDGVLNEPQRVALHRASLAEARALAAEGELSDLKMIARHVCDTSGPWGTEVHAAALKALEAKVALPAPAKSGEETR